MKHSFLSFFYLTVIFGILSVNLNAQTANLSSPIATLTSCLGTASSPTTFGVTGAGLTASMTISAPSNFEISTSYWNNSII